MFKPFLDSKARGTDNNVINLDFNDSIIQDQTKVANCLVDYFTTVANDIGDPHMLSLTEEELKDHKSVQNMRKVATTNGVQFKFRNFNVKEVTRALETLNPHIEHGSPITGKSFVEGDLLRADFTEKTHENRDD